MSTVEERLAALESRRDPMFLGRWHEAEFACARERLRADALERDLALYKGRYDAQINENTRLVHAAALSARLGAQPAPAVDVGPEAKRRLAYLRPCVQWFAERMEEQLRANDHKGGWRGDTASELFIRLREEADELRESLAGLNGPHVTNTVKEAADVANFAMMIADVLACPDQSNTAADKGVVRDPSLEWTPVQRSAASLLYHLAFKLRAEASDHPLGAWDCGSMCEEIRGVAPHFAALRSPPAPDAIGDVALATELRETMYGCKLRPWDGGNPKIALDWLAVARRARALIAPAVDVDWDAVAQIIADQHDPDLGELGHVGELPSFWRGVLAGSASAHGTRHARGEKSKAGESSVAREHTVTEDAPRLGSDSPAPSTPAATQWTSEQIDATREVCRVVNMGDPTWQGSIREPRFTNVANVCASIAKHAPLFVAKPPPIVLPSERAVLAAMFGPEEKTVNAVAKMHAVFKLFTAALASQGVETEGV